MSASLDMDARYRVDGYGGVAFYLLGYVQEPARDPETGEACPCGECGIDYDRVRAVMVGDDREHVIDADDLTALDDLEYCHVCGQIGCGHDGLDRG